MARRWLVWSAMAMAVSLATPRAGAAASSIWRVVPTPNPGGSQVSDIFFTGVSAASDAEAFAVGIDQIGASRRPLVAHWDGTAWQSVTVPRPARRQSWFNGVLELSRTDAWAVGVSSSANADNQDVRTLIEHWNGTAWSIVPSPNPAVGGASGDFLTAIDGVGPSDLWATGWVHDDALQENVLLFEHFDGTSWHTAPSPSPPGSEHFGMAIAAMATDDVWAVGNEALQSTLTAHWDGTRWTIVPSPSLQDGDSALNALTGVTAIGPSDVWASGYEGNVDNQNFMKPYMLHWDGTKWTLLPTPNLGGEGSRLNGAVALSANDVWAVGQTQELDGSILTLTEQFDGTSWTVVPSPDPGGGHGQLLVDSLHGVASGGAGNVVTVGARGIPGQCCLRSLAMRTRAG